VSKQFMEKSEVFERLVKELDPIERKELLDKLTPDEVIEAEPMLDKELETEIDLEKEYYSLGLFCRFLIFFRVIFRGEDKFQITEEIVLKDIERDIKRTAGNIISYDKGQLLVEFLEEVEKLHDSVMFFSSVLNSVGGQAREEFLNFLGSLQIPIIHHQLIIDTDFVTAEKKTGLSNPNDVRKEVLMNVDTILAKITGELRNTMYMHSKTIFNMGELAAYDFGELENLFEKINGQNEKSVYFGDVRIRLERLAEILSAFRLSPNKQLLEALYLFHNSSLKVKDQEAISDELKKFIDSALEHLKDIRKFNMRIQLPKVMKLITGDIDYKSKPATGGEDWFSLYSRYWNNIAEMKFKLYSADKRKQKIYQDMQMYFKKDKLPVLDYYRYKFRYSCGFLALFLREQFTASMNEVLKKILVDGKFYKKGNKDDFTDSYSALLGLYEKLKNFDDKNSAKGEYGMKIQNARTEAIGESAKEKRVAMVIEAADLEAVDIIRIGTEGLKLMKRVLYGILHGKAGGQYDSLSNLNKLVTIESRDFIIDLNTVYTNIDDADRILGDIITLEEAE